MSHYTGVIHFMTDLHMEVALDGDHLEGVK